MPAEALVAVGRPRFNDSSQPSSEEQGHLQRRSLNGRTQMSTDTSKQGHLQRVCKQQPAGDIGPCFKENDDGLDVRQDDRVDGWRSRDGDGRFNQGVGGSDVAPRRRRDRHHRGDGARAQVMALMRAR